MITPVTLIFIGVVSVFLYAAFKVFRQIVHEAYSENQFGADDMNDETKQTQLQSTAESDFHLKPFMSGRSSEAAVLEKAIYPYSPSLSYFESELKRAERYNRNATVLVLGLKDDQLNKLVTKENEPKFSLLGDPKSVANVLVGILSINLIYDVGFRETDVVTYNKDAQSYVILLPETPADRAKTFLERLRKNPNFVKAWSYLSAGYAQYPTDGKDIGSLFTLAQARRKSLMSLSLSAY